VKKGLKHFNPDKVAQLDLNMWQAYYSHNFFRLFILLLQLNHEFFGLNYLATLRAAYYSATAAIDFKLHRGRENSERIIKNLSKFLKIVSNKSLEKFDYKKAAELELAWWLIDRYPNKYETSREVALAAAMAAVYGVQTSALTDYANYRAQAMVLNDKAEAAGHETDWSQVGILLKKSFNSLHQSVQ